MILDLTRDRWRSINGTFGVASLVMQGGQPHPVPDGILETLISSVDFRGLLRVDRELQVGASVRLGTGPFAERLAVLEHLDDTGRVRVLLSLLGRQVHVSMDKSDVLPAGRRALFGWLAASLRRSISPQTQLKLDRPGPKQLFCRKKSFLFALQHQACEAARCKRAGVNIDPVR